MKHILLMVLICLVSESALAKTQSQAINSYLAGVAKVTQNSEYKEARKTIYGDLDGDGDKDIVVQFTLEDATGGNSWSINIAAFRNERDNYKGITDEVVGGKFYRSFTLNTINNGEIIGLTETCPDDGVQGICDSPKKGKSVYILKNYKLVER